MRIDGLLKWTSTNLIPRLLKFRLFQEWLRPILINSVKGQMDDFLKGKNMEKSKPKTLSQASNTRQTRNHKRIYLVQKSVKGLMIITGRHLISTVGVKAIDDYTVQYTWATGKFLNSKTTMGILMPVNENLWNLRGDNSWSRTLRLVSSTAVLIWLNPSLLNLSAILEKEPNLTGMRIMLRSVKRKLTYYYDGQDLRVLDCGFDNDDVYAAARVFPNGSNYKSVERRSIRTTLSILTKVPQPTTFLQHWPSGLWNHKEDYWYSKRFSTKKAILNKWSPSSHYVCL